MSEDLATQGSRPDSVLPDFELLVEMAEGEGCFGHIPALPGLCFRGENPEELLRLSLTRITDYARWLLGEKLLDISPDASALIQCVEAGRFEDIRVLEAERKIGSPVWISGNPAAFFEHDRHPLEDDSVRAHLRFTRQVVKRMRMAVAGLTSNQRVRKPAADRRSLDETLVHIGNCVWWYCSRLDDALPEPPEETGLDPLCRIERLLEVASEYLLAVPFSMRGMVHVPKRFRTRDPNEPWTHTKVCRRQAEHVWEHLPGITRAGMPGE